MKKLIGKTDAAKTLLHEFQYKTVERKNGSFDVMVLGYNHEWFVYENVDTTEEAESAIAEHKTEHAENRIGVVGTPKHIAGVIAEILNTQTEEIEIGEIYTNVYGGEFTAVDLLVKARAGLNELTDSADGTQMHRRAVVGKKLTVHAGGKKSGNEPSTRGFIVGIRIEGQYSDYAYEKMSTSATADKLAAEIEYLISLDPVGILR